MDAFDADVIIYSIANDARAARIRSLLFESTGRVGSNLLMFEVLMKPMRAGASHELSALSEHLAQIDLKPVDDDIIDVALGFSVKYSLRLADSIHLATAVLWGADRFHTNNRKDFGPHVTEVEVVHPRAGA